MKRDAKDTFTQVIQLGVGIAALAALLYGADALYFAPRRLPPCVQERLPEGRICLEHLLTTWRNKQAPGQFKVVWVDARSENDYELHHLMMNEDRVFPIRPGGGAQTQRLLDAAIERLIEADRRGECIVVFCTAECTASTEVADILRQSGLIKAPIYVLEGGWAALKKSSLVKD